MNDDESWNLSFALGQLMTQLADEVLADPIPVDVRTALDREIKTLGNALWTILKNDGKEVRKAGPQLFQAAFYIGTYHAVKFKNMSKLFKKIDQLRTVPAHKGRQRSDIQEIIERHARTLWQGKKKLMGDRDTARKIYTSVAADVRNLSNPPKWWLQKEATTKRTAETHEQTEARRHENIRKRIGKIEREDN